VTGEVRESHPPPRFGSETRLARREFIALRLFRPVDAGTSGKFPFGLGRQILAAPTQANTSLSATWTTESARTLSHLTAR
jgi:hypothetical protein